ncbi:protein kinase [Agaricus bisporus var. bisporus H97]|uniref:protein kinase n=1 Tax=Agaricus bisporus var. bisporus (strain H97 / ATCC MYA-4626 / FGSC 10389) TaxID=936046 RepID=UPI00029F5C8C|nr:protein kinase [Agaricus bisporus var. bisporus H97]EKV52041.1 protein kinase [Agaricus bisporus var. bisporus H97]
MSDSPEQDDKPDPAHRPPVLLSPAPSSTLPTAPHSRRPSTSTPHKSGHFGKKYTPSIHSDKGDGHKFNLKDLLAGAPGKISRKSSQRSVSSKHSESDVPDGPKKPKSTAGESTASLSQKYGVCHRVAIGKGATSVVRLAHKWDRTEEKLYAVKEFRKRRKNESEKEYVKKLTAEFCISSTLHHPNVVETVDLVQDEAMHWCEVMEFCPGGDLYAGIKKGGMSPGEVECCFRQILSGVDYLHRQGVAHRDIKPENLFFDSKGNIKIGDYGASTVYRLPWEATVHMSTGLCGSEPYIAPEQFLSKPYDARLVDIWACGIVYYCLHFQELPWRAAQPSSDQLYAAYVNACHNTSNLLQSNYPPTISNLNPRQCRSLIRKMLEPDPEKRWPIEQVMEHEWVRGIEVCSVVRAQGREPKHSHACAKATGQNHLAALNGN